MNKPLALSWIVAGLLLLGVSYAGNDQVEKQITVSRIVVSSTTPVRAEQLQPVLSRYENRPLALKDLLSLQNDLNTFMAQNGYGSIKAQIGDIAADTLTVQMTPVPSSITSEGIAALSIAETSKTATKPDSNAAVTTTPRTGMVDRYWRRFFQAKPVPTPAVNP